MPRRRQPLPRSDALTRRQTQAMDALHRLGEATAAEIRSDLAQHGIRISYPAVKSALRGLVEEGRAEARREGRANRYSPAASRDAAARSSLRSWLRTFFDDAPGAAVLAFLDEAEEELSDSELSAIRERLRQIQADDAGERGDPSS